MVGTLSIFTTVPIFIAELRKPRKMGNTSRILVKMVLLDAEFILVFIDSKTSTNKHLLAEKSHFFQVYII